MIEKGTTITLSNGKKSSYRGTVIHTTNLNDNHVEVTIVINKVHWGKLSASENTGKVKLAETNKFLREYFVRDNAKDSKLSISEIYALYENDAHTIPENARHTKHSLSNFLSKLGFKKVSFRQNGAVTRGYQGLKYKEIREITEE